MSNIDPLNYKSQPYQSYMSPNYDNGLASAAVPQYFNMDPVNPNQSFVGSTPQVNTTPQTNFDWSKGLSNFALGAQGITGLMSAYNAYNQNRLMEKQYAASLAGMNKNLANQATTVNDQLYDKEYMRQQMNGANPNTPGFDETVRKDQVRVDGSPIRG